MNKTAPDVHQDTIAGLGCRAGASATDIIAVLHEAEARADRRAIALAIPAFKLREPGLNEAAALLGLPLILIDDTALAAVQWLCVTHSATVAAHTGHASIAEAAALAACGPGATLRLPRIAHPTATCALADRAGPSA